MKNKFLIIVSIFTASICLGVVSYFVAQRIVTSKSNFFEIKTEADDFSASNEMTATSTEGVLQEEVTSPMEGITSWNATIPSLSATLIKELESKDLKISFPESMYALNSISGGASVNAVYNFPPKDAGNEAWIFSTTTNWIISIEENFTYKPDYAMKCESSIGKITIDGRLVNICRDGWDNDVYGINTFIFDDLSKAMVSIRAATMEAKGDAISTIETGLKWK